MPYIKKKCRAGRTASYDYYYTARYNDGERGSREKKSKPTGEAQKAVNLRKAAQECTRILNANFGPEDYYLTLTYKKELRPEPEEMKDHIRELLRKLRTVQKKAGTVLKYVWTAEIGKRGAAHFHMVVNHIPIQTVRDAWPHGYIKVQPLDPCGQYSALADYLVKYAERTWESVGHHVGKRYNPSRGLIRPEPEKKIILGRRKIPEEIPVPKGWYLDKNTVRRGIHEITGYEYLSYILIRIDKRKPSSGTEGERKYEVELRTAGKRAHVPESGRTAEPRGPGIFKD